MLLSSQISKDGFIIPTLRSTGTYETHRNIFRHLLTIQTTRQAFFFHKHLILLLLSLCIPHTHTDSDGCVRVYVWTVSLHSALNEPIMGVYVALMRVSVRRETLHRSPPNQ